MKASIITIGTEIVSGFITDLNSVFIAQFLATELGIETVKFVAVPDEESEILSAMRYAGEDDVMIITGGLGPTTDDFTREMISKFTGLEMEIDEKAREIVAEKYRSYGLVAGTDALRQSQKPLGAKLIYPLGGTAPGIVLLNEEKLIIALPGVPKEVRDMLPQVKSHVTDYLRAHQIEPAGIKVVSFLIYGMGEVQVEDKLRPHLDVPDGLRYNILGSPMGITINLILVDSVSENAISALNELINAIEAEFAEDIISRDSELVENNIGKLLISSGRFLAVAESCTGGMLAEKITAVSGSSEYFLGGVVSYSNEAKTKMLGVDPELILDKGAVSEEVALAMAAGARSRFGADIGIGITGLAGPSGGTDAKPVGLVYIALDAAPSHGRSAGSISYCAEKFFTGDRETVRRRTCQFALSLLFQLLNGRKLK